MPPDVVDIFIIGGGINGCGIARDAAGRGFSVHLAEMNDLASGTSSASTKLIHGGLRYLEHYDFRLVREALMEREVLWAMAPHIIQPLRFVLPYRRGMRPAWLLRLGLFIYDHLGGRKALPGTRVLHLADDEAGRPLKPQFVRAFEYSDCWVDDARLVILNARDAAERGAAIATRSRVVAARRDGAQWSVTVEDPEGLVTEIRARLLVNASGPWVDEVLAGPLSRSAPRNVRLVKGSHIVVEKKFDHDRAYFFQNPDGRIFFAIPYEDDFTLIGTTDRDQEGQAEAIGISEWEIDYLCAGASEYFREPVTRGDIVWSFSGIRALYDDGASKAQEATREYVLTCETDAGKAPLINVFGGKITTYRRLAEAAMEIVEDNLGKRSAPWTAGAALPGGDFAATELGRQVERLSADYPFLTGAHALRLIRQYGTRVRNLLGSAGSAGDLGRCFGADLYEKEVSYLMDQEWAITAEDVLWRRTKLGLRLSKDETAALDRWMKWASPTIPFGEVVRRGQ